MIAEIQAFLDRGGPVVVLIAVTTFFMWALILERLFYFHVAHRAVAKNAVDEWQSRSDRNSTLARWVRDKIVSDVR
ncbi:MAG: MotA/TolQ/ExbB proton channel family protein, partial [Pseudomonadota bacterium]